MKSNSLLRRLEALEEIIKPTPERGILGVVFHMPKPEPVPEGLCHKIDA